MNFPLHRGLFNKKSLGPFRPVRPAGLDFQVRPGPRAARPIAIYRREACRHGRACAPFSDFSCSALSSFYSGVSCCGISCVFHSILVPKYGIQVTHYGCKVFSFKIVTETQSAVCVPIAQRYTWLLRRSIATRRSSSRAGSLSIDQPIGSRSPWLGHEASRKLVLCASSASSC